jgi:hypothetical protein
MSILNSKPKSKLVSYSEYLQLVINQIKYNDITDKDKSYICNIVQYSYLLKYDEYNLHRERLLKTIKSKLDAQNKRDPLNKLAETLSKTIGYGSQARIKWLESLIKYHRARESENQS